MLVDATELIRIAKQVRLLAVSAERELGQSWQEVGDTLGRTRSTVHARYSDQLIEDPLVELEAAWQDIAKLAQEAVARVHVAQRIKADQEHLHHR